MYDVGCQFVKKEDSVDTKVTNQETSTVSFRDNIFNYLRFVYTHLYSKQLLVVFYFQYGNKSVKDTAQINRALLRVDL